MRRGNCNFDGVLQDKWGSAEMATGVLRAQVQAYYGYRYGRAMGTGTGVLWVQVRACYGCRYGRATGAGTGVLRVRIQAYGCRS